MAGSAEVVAMLLHTTLLGVEERLMTHIEREMHSFSQRGVLAMSHAQTYTCTVQYKNLLFK